MCVCQHPAYSAIVGDALEQTVIGCSHHNKVCVVCFCLSQKFYGRIAVNNPDVDLCA
jgi:hypothetical protein